MGTQQEKRPHSKVCPLFPSVDFSPSECGSAGLGNDGHFFRAEASR
jgi:hypothetical protein